MLIRWRITIIKYPHREIASDYYVQLKPVYSWDKFCIKNSTPKSAYVIGATLQGEFTVLTEYVLVLCSDESASQKNSIVSLFHWSINKLSVKIDDIRALNYFHFMPNPIIHQDNVPLGPASGDIRKYSLQL